MSILRWLLYFALIALAAIHTDVWFWNDATLIWAFPVGLFFHIIFCLAASLLMAGLVKFAWPSHLEMERDGDS